MQFNEVSEANIAKIWKILRYIAVFQKYCYISKKSIFFRQYNTSILKTSAGPK